MNSRKENETFYQNNGVELSDEALANVVGGCGQSHDCNGWGEGNDGGNGNGHGRGCHEHGLLGNLLCDLL
jgi:hypothetical protein